MAVARRHLLGARGALVEVRRQRERGGPAAQRESRLKVESIVNSAYSRDKLASWAAAASRARSLGKAAVSTLDIAPEMQEWADGYDGCCGVGNTVWIPASACPGRMYQ